MTNNLSRRLSEHYSNKGNPSTFAGKYHCYNLIYYEVFQSVWMAIAREKEIKGWVRRKKENLIHDFNPEWEFFDLRFVDWL
jgi:putative endonuclease